MSRLLLRYRRRFLQQKFPRRSSHITIYPDKTKIDSLVSSGLVFSQESAFNREHGITNILGDIADNFPNARLIPLMLKQNLSKETTAKLSDELARICPQNCLMVSSVDFSHY